MAIFHCAVQIISRGKGRSSVASAAYRSGEKLVNNYDGLIHDFTRKKGISYTEILLPESAPAEYMDRQTLWNSVEKIEKSKLAQTSREIEVSLPTELSKDEQISLLHEYIKANFVDRGMCVDLALHDKADGNPHAHIMLTMRPINLDGTWGVKQKKVYEFDSNGNKIYDKKKKTYKCSTVKTTDWDNPETLLQWREQWAAICNREFERKNIDERIDHRSYEAQGIDKIPTRHVGAFASKLEKQNVETEMLTA